jgi:hypothetical protein
MTARPAREGGWWVGGWGAYLVHERLAGPSQPILFFSVLMAPLVLCS